ncbi:MAG: hypothetical protein ACTHN8_08450 [Angustibacter sp.]
MRRHDLDVTSLVFGLIFLGVAATWALVQTELVTLPDLSLLGPAVLIVAGVVGLAATLAKGQRDQRGRDAVDDS